MREQVAQTREVLEALVELNERLLSDPTKDVTFELADGREYAHRAVLAAASDVWGRMLGSTMQERNGVIRMPDVDCVAMRVFLRLIYTAHIDPADWGKGDSADNNTKLPVELLLQVAKLAKRYMVDAVLSIATQALKARLTELKARGLVLTFEKILSAAIKTDLSAVRMAALDLARTFQALKVRYNRKELQPEVLAELQAIWPTPKVSRKRARLE